jgi:membrane protein DedA with SNARE-associated domain
VWATAVAVAGYSLAYSWRTLERWIGNSGLVALLLVLIVAAIAIVRARQERKS